MVRKTHEEYVSELAIKNPNVEVVGVYVDSKTKILHHCLKHGINWHISPLKALSGNGCEKCRVEKLAKNRTLTHESYIEKLLIKNPTVKAVEKYIGAKSKILHHCMVHDIDFCATPSDVLQGHGCSMCKSEKISKKLSKTHEQYIEDVKKVNPNISVIGKYVNANNYVLHKCLKDGYEWNARPANVLSGFGCPKCSERFRRTHNDYILEVEELNPDVVVVGKFNGLQTPILHKCAIHDVEWMANPESILRGCRCWKCGNDATREKITKTHCQYVDDLKSVNPDVMVIDTYAGCFTPILHKCMIDGYEWMAVPTYILSGRGCPRCQESTGEREIRQWLEENNIEYVFQKTFQDCKDKRELPFDFYLPQYNSIIEYDGGQHFKPIPFFGGYDAFEARVKHDKIKDQYCETNNIRLLRIPYFKDVDTELNNFIHLT